VQHDDAIQSPLPLDTPQDITNGQPIVNTGADAPIYRGSYVFPQTTHDRFAIELFAAERGLKIYRKSPHPALIHTIFYDEANDRIFKIVVKDRWVIDRNYIGRDLWIGFRIQDELYLMPHDEMVRAAETDGISWNTHGTCTRSRLSASMRSQCVPYRTTPEPGKFWLAMPTLFSSR
jgi:hypothetical protein